MNNRIRIKIDATIDRTGKFGSKLLIKTRFESDLSRFGDLSRLDRISLQQNNCSAFLEIAFQVFLVQFTFSK